MPQGGRGILPSLRECRLVGMGLLRMPFAMKQAYAIPVATVNHSNNETRRR